MGLSVSSVAAMLASSLVLRMALGPEDPVGIDDDAGELELREVSIDGARWQQLRELAEAEAPIVRPPGPWAVDRRVAIERASDGLRIRVTWTLAAIESGWLNDALIGPITGLRVESLRWRGRELAVAHTDAGEAVALEMAANSRGELELVAFIPVAQLQSGLDGSLELALMPAVRGELRVTGNEAPAGRVPELTIYSSDGGSERASEARRLIDDRFWAGEQRLRLDWVEPKSIDASSQGPLAVAQTAVGLTFGDGELRGRARVSWLLRRGQLDRVSIEAAGLGRDLELAGPNIHAWSINGDRIDIELKEPADGRIDIDLRWTQGLASGAEARLAAPLIKPQQAYRSETFLQIARDGELEIVPKLAGVAALASTELPEWAGGFIQGSPTASYRIDRDDPSSSFELLRFVPLSGPPVMVDVAAYEIATTDEGRSLVHARYDVRNERASHLRVQLPDGSRLLGVRVNGEATTPARDAHTGAHETWRVPLVRSLESVKGSLSFPVELVFIHEDDEWAKRETRALSLPALDAPVAVSRVRVYLPPNYQNRVALGDFNRVDSFSEGEGITYGLGVGAGSAEVSQADELYREALSRWMSNDFEQAQSSLDQLRSLGASNANIDGLQANLDLVQGRSEPTVDEDSGGGGGQSAIVSRRIKDQAKVRAKQDQLELLEKAREAEKLEASGDYDKAEQKLAEAQEIGDRLALLEQSESKEQAVYNQALSSKSARVADKKKRKQSRESAAGKRPSSIVYEFENDDIAGELLVPQGTTTAGPVGGEDAPPPPAPPPNEPEPIAEAEELIVMDDLESAPSRDFTAVVESVPGVAQSVDGPRRPRRDAKPRPAKPTDGKGKKSDKSAPPMTIAAPPADPNAALAGPVVTASAITVHVPAIGEAVLYQHMLLPEGTPLAVHLEARRHKPHKRKPRS